MNRAPAPPPWLCILRLRIPGSASLIPQRARISLALMRLPELAAVHDRSLALCLVADRAFAGSLAGKLLLRTAFDPDGIADLIASSVAGAASLCIDPQPELLREGLRAGFCDFVVGHLDEALRILKNELRKGRAVSVGLSADPETCLAEIVERGLQPDLLSTGRPAPAPSHVLLDRGAFDLASLPAPDLQTSIVEWTLAADAALSAPAVARLAADSLDSTRPDTPARRRWLERSPAYLGRAFGPRQCLRMTVEETAALRAALDRQFPSLSVTLLAAEN